MTKFKLSEDTDAQITTLDELEGIPVEFAHIAILSFEISKAIKTYIGKMIEDKADFTNMTHFAPYSALLHELVAGAVDDVVLSETGKPGRTPENMEAYKEFMSKASELSEEMGNGDKPLKVIYAEKKDLRPEMFIAALAIFMSKISNMHHGYQIAVNALGDTDNTEEGELQAEETEPSTILN